MIRRDQAQDPEVRAPDGQGHGPDVARDGAGAVARSVPMVDARLDSRDLFAEGRVVTIAHGDHVYQLRLTHQNKLILTK